MASVSEGRDVLGVPAWRVNFGNIAAGATAGATVEAGTQFPYLLFCDIKNKL